MLGMTRGGLRSSISGDGTGGRWKPTAGVVAHGAKWRWWRYRGRT